MKEFFVAVAVHVLFIGLLWIIGFKAEGEGVDKGRLDMLQSLRPCVTGVEQTYVLNEHVKFVCAFGVWEAR